MMSPTVTENYPDEPPKFEERFRGVHVLQRDDNGMEKCVACFLCAAACPSNCIYIEAAENTEQVRISGGERYAKVYNIDYNRCIFCGYCVEACPTDAITHGHGFEVASYNTSTLVKRKEDMLAPMPPGAKPPVIASGRSSGALARIRHVNGRIFRMRMFRAITGTDRHHLPRRSGGQERGRDLSLLSRLPRHPGASPGAQAVPAGACRCCRA